MEDFEITDEFLAKFMGRNVEELMRNLDGWTFINPFNDYKWVWVKPELNKTIICKAYFDPDKEQSIIEDIWTYDGIYSEH